jgi:transmembrane sensor
MVPTGPVDETTATSQTQAQARAWLVRLRSGEATPEDFQAYRRWCAEHPEYAPGVKLVNQAWDRLQTAAAEYVAEHADEHPLVSVPRLRDDRPQVARHGRRAFVGFALAAGASWLALRPPLRLWPSVGELAADYHTGTGEQRQVALSDRVTVALNTQTRIDVLRGQDSHGIDLLAGEAEVAAAAGAAAGTGAGRTVSARPVVVVAAQGRVHADVARFDVRRSGNTVCVTCVSGSVVVEHPQQRLTLMAAQQVVYDDEGMRPVSQVDPAVTTAWRRGILIFKGTPLTEVIGEINRYRPGQIILRKASLGGSKVEAEVRTADLDRAIDLFSSVYGLHVTRLPGDIVLLS